MNLVNIGSFDKIESHNNVVFSSLVRSHTSQKMNNHNNGKKRINRIVTKAKKKKIPSKSQEILFRGKIDITSTKTTNSSQQGQPPQSDLVNQSNQDGVDESYDNSSGAGKKKSVTKIEICEKVREEKKKEEIVVDVDNNKNNNAKRKKKKKKKRKKSISSQCTRILLELKHDTLNESESSSRKRNVSEFGSRKREKGRGSVFTSPIKKKENGIENQIETSLENLENVKELENFNSFGNKIKNQNQIIAQQQTIVHLFDRKSVNEVKLHLDDVYRYLKCMKTLSQNLLMFLKVGSSCENNTRMVERMEKIKELNYLTLLIKKKFFLLKVTVLKKMRISLKEFEDLFNSSYDSMCTLIKWNNFLKEINWENNNFNANLNLKVLGGVLSKIFDLIKKLLKLCEGLLDGLDSFIKSIALYGKDDDLREFYSSMLKSLLFMTLFINSCKKLGIVADSLIGKMEREKMKEQKLPFISSGSGSGGNEENAKKESRKKLKLVKSLSNNVNKNRNRKKIKIRKDLIGAGCEKEDRNFFQISGNSYEMCENKMVLIKLGKRDSIISWENRAKKFFQKDCSKKTKKITIKSCKAKINKKPSEEKDNVIIIKNQLLIKKQKEEEEEEMIRNDYNFKNYGVEPVNKMNKFRKILDMIDFKEKKKNESNKGKKKKLKKAKKESKDFLIIVILSI